VALGYPFVLSVSVHVTIDELAAGSVNAFLGFWLKENNLEGNSTIVEQNDTIATDSDSPVVEIQGGEQIVIVEVPVEINEDVWKLIIIGGILLLLIIFCALCILVRQIQANN